MLKREFSTHRGCLKLPFLCWSQHISGRFGQISCQWHLLATVTQLTECFISSFSSNLNLAQTVSNHALQVTQGGKYSLLKIHRFEHWAENLIDLTAGADLNTLFSQIHRKLGSWWHLILSLGPSTPASYDTCPLMTLMSQCFMLWPPLRIFFMYIVSQKSKMNYIHFTLFGC